MVCRALSALTHDTPFLLARFTPHLASAHDPQRFVQCWSNGPRLVIEATGHLHHPELADPARLTGGWSLTPAARPRRLTPPHPGDGRTFPVRVAAVVSPGVSRPGNG